MLDRNPLDAAGKVGLPVGLVTGYRFDGFTLIVGQIAIPAKLLEHGHGELGITVLDFRVDRIAALGQEVVPVPLDAEARTEAETAFGHRLRGVVEQRRSGMVHLGSAPARPRQAIEVAVGRPAPRLQGGPIEGGLIGHMQLEPLGRLAGVADRPHALVDFPQRVLDRRHGAVDRDVLEHLVGETELLGQEIDDLVVRLRFEQRLDDRFAPLQRAVGSGNGAVGLELRCRRQEIDAVGPVVHHRRHGREGIDDDKHVELAHRLLHVRQTGLRVRSVAPEHHGPQAIRLFDVLLGFERQVEPAGHRNAGLLHQVLGGELAEQIVVLDIPHAGPVLPRPGLETVVAGQGVAQHAEIGRALHVVMAAEDVGTAARGADHAEGQAQDAVGAGIVVAVGVLRTAHAPDDGEGTVVGQRAGDPLELGARHAGDTLGLFRRPLGHLGLDLVHTPDTLLDVLPVFPAVLEDVPEDAPDEPHVGAGAETDVLVRMRRGSREARVANDEGRVVLLLRLEQVKQRNGVRLGGVTADEEDRARIVDVVIGVRHRAVAPGVGNTCDRG